jgi:hypothetical protein
VIPDFRREVAENCALLGYYSASSVNFLRTFRDNLSVPTDRLSRNFGYKLRLLAERSFQHPLSEGD